MLKTLNYWCRSDVFSAYFVIGEFPDNRKYILLTKNVLGCDT